jgi:hypothetical protein
MSDNRCKDLEDGVAKLLVSIRCWASRHGGKIPDDIAPAYYQGIMLLSWEMLPHEIEQAKAIK